MRQKRAFFSFSLLVIITTSVTYVYIFNISVFHSKTTDWISTATQSTRADQSTTGKVRRLSQVNTRLLCWVMTSPTTILTKAVHVHKTWGKRCDKLIFMSSSGTKEKVKHLPVVDLPVGEGRGNLWQKTREAFIHIYRYHIDEFDWFLKADDDTYVIVENLRHFLREKSPDDSVYYGRRFKPFVSQGFMSGGAGYVLSRQAVKSMLEFGNSSENYLRNECEPKGRNFVGEDVEIGFCLEKVGVKAGDTRDNKGRERFMPMVPETHLIPGLIPTNSWYWSHIYYPAKQGKDCCSDTAISFHYVTPNMMYVLDYLIYTLRLADSAAS